MTDNVRNKNENAVMGTKNGENEQLLRYYWPGNKNKISNTAHTTAKTKSFQRR